MVETPQEQRGVTVTPLKEVEEAVTQTCQNEYSCGFNGG